MLGANIFELRVVDSAEKQVYLANEQKLATGEITSVMIMMVDNVFNTLFLNYRYLC